MTNNKIEGVVLTDALITIITHFFSLCSAAMENGGFWVSTGGGTANVAAGIISRYLDIQYADAHEALNIIGGDDWYVDLYWGQPHYDEPEYYRWDIDIIARAACRHASGYQEPISCNRIFRM